MKHIIQLSSIVILISLFAFACNDSKEENDNKKSDSSIVEQVTETQNEHIELADANFVILETEFGNMKIKLYDKTPKHKENFLKLASQNYFNDLLFHRVIKDFMVQGGDPDSKNAPAGTMLGNGGPGYQIEAEFNDSLFHKKGVLSAAREGDQVNPEKKSSGSQFYIVQGKKYTDEELNYMEEQSSAQNYILSHEDVFKELQELQNKRDNNAIDKLFKDVINKKDFILTKIPDFKRKAYKEIGGTPFLDNNYTVFGEVVEGLDVIDKIANVQTDQYDRPIKDIKMKIKLVKE